MTVKNALQEKAAGGAPTSKEGAPKSMKQWIEAMKPEIEKALPSVITPERFTRMAMTALSTNAKLASTTPRSFCGALLNAAQLGLEPNTPLGQAYLIPYGKETQFQIGYKGMLDLAHRSGEFKNIYAKEVYEGDDFSYSYGLEPTLNHVPTMDIEGRGEVIYYYAVYTLVNGGFGFEVMTKAEVEKHGKKFSKAYKSGPWQTDFDEMAKKTVVKKVLKYAPIKTEFVKGISQDSTIKHMEEGEDNSNMQDADDKSIFAEFEVVDDETGEIAENV